MILKNEFDFKLVLVFILYNFEPQRRFSKSFIHIIPKLKDNFAPNYQHYNLKIKEDKDHTSNNALQDQTSC